MPIPGHIWAGIGNQVRIILLNARLLGRFAAGPGALGQDATDPALETGRCLWSPVEHALEALLVGPPPRAGDGRSQLRLRQQVRGRRLDASSFADRSTSFPASLLAQLGR